MGTLTAVDAVDPSRSDRRPTRPPLALPDGSLPHADPPLALRPWRSAPGDVAALAAAWADPDVVRWTAVPADHGPDAAARWIAGEGQRRADGVAVDLAVTLLEDQEMVIGEVGLVVANAERGWAEVGYWMLPAWRGGGRARAALALFTQWALRDLPLRRLFARTAADNPASGAVAAGAGYRRRGRLADGTVVWSHDAPPVDADPG